MTPKNSSSSFCYKPQRSLYSINNKIRFYQG